MAPPKRIPDAAVIQAIREWRGNVEGAADQLRITSSNLRKRLVALEVNLATLRQGGTDSYHSHPIPSIPMTPIVAGKTHQGESHKSQGRLYPRRVPRPNLTDVSTAPAAAERPIRVSPTVADVIRRGRRRLSAATDQDIDDTALLAKFVAETFEPWVNALVEQAAGAGANEDRPEGEKREDH